MNKLKNYEIIKEDNIKITRYGKEIILYRIKAIVDIDKETPKGLIGGYIEDESNLISYQGEDTAFIYKLGKVYNGGVVKGGMKLYFGEYTGDK